MSTLNEELPPTQAIPEGTKPITRYTAEHGREVGLPSPEAINFMMSVCNLITSTALIGKDMGLTKEQKAEMLQAGFTNMEVWEKNQAAIKANSMAKMLVGHEFNPPIPPMAAQQEISIVKSKIFVSYPHLITQMEARGLKFKTVQRTHERAAWEVTRPGEAEPELFEFTIEDAKKAGLIRTSRDGEPLQYELRPRVMLWARLVSETYRATGGRGGVYVNEEKREIEESEDRRDSFNQEQPERTTENPFRPMQRPAAIEAAPEPITMTPKVEKEPVAVEKSVNGQASIPVEPAKGKGPRSHVKAAEARSQPAPEPAKSDSKPASVPPTEDRDDWLPQELGGTPAPSSSNIPTSSSDSQLSSSKTADAPPTPAQRREEPMPGPQLVKDTPNPTQNEMLNTMIGELQKLGNYERASIQQTLKRWIMAFTNLPAWKNCPQPTYDVPLEFLEREVRRDGLAILQDPHGAGLVSGSGWNELVRFLDKQKYEEPLKSVVKRAALAHASDNPGLLIDMFKDAQEEGPLPDAELVALFTAYCISPASTVPFQEKATHDGITMEELLAKLPDSGKATEADILTLIAGGR